VSVLVEKLVSVVIPVLKIDKYTKIAIERTLELYPRINVYIIADEILDYDNPLVSQIQSESKNLSNKRNQGVKVSQTPFIAFLDSDAYPEPGWLESALKFLEENIKCSLVGGPNLKYEYSDIEQEIPITAYKSFLINNEPSNLSSPKKVDFVASSNLLFRKQVYEEVNGMNPGIYTGEDIELCYKIRSKGHEIYFLPEMKVRHKQRALKGFLKQRFVWGRGVFTVLKYVFPNYLTSLIPLFLILLGIILLGIDSSLDTLFFLSSISLYALICLVESVRISHNILKAFKVFPYVFSSLPVLGLGTLYAVFRGDINNDYRYYRNDE
jgi:GT2 family glycosyltransferase